MARKGRGSTSHLMYENIIITTNKAGLIPLRNSLLLFMLFVIYVVKTGPLNYTRTELFLCFFHCLKKLE